MLASIRRFSFYRTPQMHPFSRLELLLKERTFAERAFSVSTYLTVAIPGGFLALVADPARGSGAFFNWLGVVTIASLVAGIFFVLFGRLIFSKLQGWARVSAGLIGFALTGSIRGGLLGVFGFQSGAIDQINWQFRLGGGAIVALVMLPLAATLINDYSNFRTRLRELAANQQHLAELTTNAKTELQAKRSLVLGEVNARLGEVISEISREIGKGRSAAAYKKLASKLLNAVETVVRPLSKELLAESWESKTVGAELRPSRLNVKTWFVSVTLTQPFRPLPVALIWSAIGASTISALQPGWPGVLAYPLFVGSTWAFLAIGERYLAPRLNSLAIGPRAVVIMAWYLIVAIIPAVLSWLPLADLERPGFEALALTLLVLDPFATILICVTLAMLAGLKSERLRVLNENLLVNKQLSWELAALSAQLHALRKQISRSIHSDVQAVFIACAVKLQAAIDAGKVTPDLLRELVRNLNSIGELNPGEKPTQSLASALEEFQTFWGDSVSFQFNLEAEAQRVVGLNQVVRATLIELCSEAVLNAVKHGNASRIEISLTLEGDVVHLVVKNNGKALAKNLIKGGGMRLAREVSVEYGLINYSSGVQFSSTLPVSKP